MKRSLLSLLGLVVCVSIALPQESSPPKQRALVLAHVMAIDSIGPAAERTIQILLLAASRSAFARQQRSSAAAERRIAFDSDQSGPYDI